MEYKVQEFHEDDIHPNVVNSLMMEYYTYLQHQKCNLKLKSLFDIGLIPITNVEYGVVMCKRLT